MDNVILEFEHPDFFVVSKPAGLPTLKSSSEVEETLQDWVQKKFPQNHSIPDAGIVHRLDNSTCGLIVVARTRPVYEHLRLIWNTDEVQKEYLALCLGIVPAQGLIEKDIAHHPSIKKKMMVCENENESQKNKGRKALTKFSRLSHEKIKGQEYSWVSISITTGVRHQIRVHMASLGFPLAGDTLYQNPAKKKQDVFPKENALLQLKKLTLNYQNELYTISSLIRMSGL